MRGGHLRAASESSSFESSSDFDPSVIDECTSERNAITGNHDRSVRSSQQHRCSVKHEKPIEVLQRVEGNDTCADCDAPEPDWASLNLGVLVCIECSGVHRNLGVHISKVRSLTLDVKVWEPSVINLFQSLGNSFANSIWEELLHLNNNLKANDTPSNTSFCKFDKNHQQLFIRKPDPTDPISLKEKFIHAKYAEKLFVCKTVADRPFLSVAQKMWDSVRINDKKAVYRHIVDSDVDVNGSHGHAPFSTSLTLAKVMLLHEKPGSMLDRNSSGLSGDSLQKVSSPSSTSSVRTSEDRNEVDAYVDGCSLLHLACQTADIGMIELLLQYGANINAPDLKGQTPLHHCIIRNRIAFAKLLLTRGADPRAVDKEGKTPLQCGMEMGTINDEEIVILLADTNR